MRKSPSDTMQDDEETAHDLAAPPSYAEAPPTIEARPSPFHHLAGQFTPVITSKTPTAPGPGEVVLVPPITFSGDLDPMAGPTAPEGHPISGSFDAPTTDPGFLGGPWIDSTPTTPGSSMPVPVPVVPPPDAPNILVSQSLMLEAVAPDTEVTRPSTPLPPPRRRHAPQYGPGPHMPTEVALPAIKRKKPKEGTDTMLILGLIGVGLLIAIVVAAVSYAIVKSMAPRRVDLEPTVLVA